MTSPDPVKKSDYRALLRVIAPYFPNMWARIVCTPRFSAILALAKMGIQGQNSGLTYFDLTGRFFQLG